jgi:hypothetical protein
MLQRSPPKETFVHLAALCRLERRSADFAAVRHFFRKGHTKRYGEGDRLQPAWQTGEDKQSPGKGLGDSKFEVELRSKYLG